MAKSTLRRGITLFFILVTLLIHGVLFATVNFYFPHYKILVVTVRLLKIIIVEYGFSLNV